PTGDHNYEIMYRRADTSTVPATWNQSVDLRLTNDNDGSFLSNYPKVAVGPVGSAYEAYVIVVWEDARNASNLQSEYPNTDLYLKYSWSDGEEGSWSEDLQITSVAEEFRSAYFASVAVDGDGRVHVVYTESDGSGGRAVMYTSANLAE
ncbi:MAG: hypothetical protein HN348_15725, partial [Proteobacteria bacterium]|nr:hypothetical protein [Pseudomonadota bacterium]